MCENLFLEMGENEKRWRQFLCNISKYVKQMSCFCKQMWINNIDVINHSI